VLTVLSGDVANAVTAAASIGDRACMVYLGGESYDVATLDGVLRNGMVEQELAPYVKSLKVYRDSRSRPLYLILDF